MFQIISLRKVRRLRALTLESNPVSTAEDYALFTAALLPELRFLDHRLVARELDHDEPYR